MHPQSRLLTLLFATAISGCDLLIAPPPATQPAPSTTQPAPHTFLIGCESDTAERDVYLASPAPATVHVQALNLLADPTHWLHDHFTWDFGDRISPQLVTDPRTDKPVDIGTSIDAPVAAYLYESPGTYTITMRHTAADGQVQTHTAQVIVPPANRRTFYVDAAGNDADTGLSPQHALRTADRAAAVLFAAGNHAELLFKRGNIFPMRGTLTLTHQDLLIDAYGDPALPLPVLRGQWDSPTTAPTTSPTTSPTTLPAESDSAESPPRGATLLSFWQGASRDVTVRHIRLDSQSHLVTSPQGYAYHAGSARGVMVRGQNITIADSEGLTLGDYLQSSSAAGGVLLLRNKQVDPRGIEGRTLWLEGRDVVAIGNVGLNSIGESPIRAAASGVVRGLIEWNYAAQEMDPAHGRSGAKAAVTLRTLQDVAVLNNFVKDGEFSFNALTNAALVQRVRADGNVVQGSLLHVKPNVRHAVFSNNAILRDGGPCVVVSPFNGDVKMWIEDVTITGTQASGWLPNSRLLQMDSHPADSLKDFNCDETSNHYTRVKNPNDETRSPK